MEYAKDYQTALSRAHNALCHTAGSLDHVDVAVDDHMSWKAYY